MLNDQAPAFVRRAVPEDADAIGRMHVASWRAAYAHILPADLLQNLSWEENAARKRGLIEKGIPIFVASCEGNVHGFAIAGENRYRETSPCDGELQAIYVHPDATRGGIGRALLVACVDYLLDKGFQSMAVFFFRDNHNAKAFYTQHGARHHNSSEYEVNGIMYPDECYVWDSLGELKDHLSKTK